MILRNKKLYLNVNITIYSIFTYNIYWSWTTLSRLQVVQIEKLFKICEIYLVYDILTNFCEDPIINPDFRNFDFFTKL